MIKTPVDAEIAPGGCCSLRVDAGPFHCLTIKTSVDAEIAPVGAAPFGSTRALFVELIFGNLSSFLTMFLNDQFNVAGQN